MCDLNNLKLMQINECHEKHKMNIRETVKINLRKNNFSTRISTN